MSLREQLIDCIIAENKRLKAEVEMWKDRYEAEHQAHEATMASVDKTMRDIMYGHN